MKKMMIALCLTISTISFANQQPFCAQAQRKSPKIIAYLGADSSWDLKKEDLGQLSEQLSKVTLVNYSFARLAIDQQGNTILEISAQDIENIKLLRQLKPGLPIILAVGGWGEREGFDAVVSSKDTRALFIQSALDILHRYQLDGIDIDWENELLASQQEINGIAALMRELKTASRKPGYCVTNAVPGNEAYWKKYPKTKLWADAVDWTTVMAYDNYGTFGSRTEHGAALYEPHRPEDNNYPYPGTSGDRAVNYYFHQGLPAEKIVLGIPFYCHSYYVDNKNIDTKAENPGLYAPVIDPNINSQISYKDAWKKYGEKLFLYQQKTAFQLDAINFYGLIPIENTQITRFMSCDNPQSIMSKIAYIKGRNSFSEKAQKKISLGGVSFWSLQQDLPVSDSNSLLRAIVDGLQQ